MLTTAQGISQMPLAQYNSSLCINARDVLSSCGRECSSSRNSLRSAQQVGVMRDNLIWKLAGTSVLVDPTSASDSTSRLNSQ